MMEKTTEVMKLIPQEQAQNRTVKQITDVPIPRVMEENTDVAQAPEWEEPQGFRAEELVTIRDVNKLPDDSDSLELFKQTSCLVDIGRAQDEDTSLATDTKSHGSTIAEPTAAAQHRNNNHRKQQQQAGQVEEKGKQEKGRKGEGERGQAGRKKEEEKEAVGERGKQVEKDVMDWIVVRRNRRQRKRTVQIFVKVKESKAFPLDVSPDDRVNDVIRQIQSDEDAYVTVHGRMLRRSEKLKSCEVTDGCMIQVTSRLRGGGSHKHKRSMTETKRNVDESRKKDQQVGSMSDKCQEMTNDQKDALIQTIERDEGYRRLITTISEAEDWEYKIQCFGKQLQEKSEIGQERAKVMEWGMRWVVEARKRRRDEEQGQSTGQQQGKKDKQVHFGEEEPLEETQAEITDKPKVMGRLAEVRTGRGSACIVQGRDEKCLTNETCRKGKGKGNGGKGEHGLKGEAGSKGTLHVENSVTDEDHENITVMTSEEKEKRHKEDVRKLVEMVEKEEAELEMMQQEEMEHEEQRGRVAPNMGAGGSHLQATSDPLEEETEERRKRARRPRWTDCEDDEGKEEEEQETREKKEQEKEKETGPETGHKEQTSEKPPGLEQRVESEQEAREEERRAQEARELRRAQEAREEERRAQEAHEEQRRAQKAQEQRRAQEEQEREAKAQEERKKEVKDQEERERLARKAKAQEEQEWQTRKTEAPKEQGVQERRVEAQGGHEDEGDETTREGSVEEKGEGTNSMQEKNHVSSRHMTWWQKSWWVRKDNGPHLRTARGRRQAWRAATRAAREMRVTDETQCESGGRERERDWGNGEEEKATHCTSCCTYPPTQLQQQQQ